MMLNTTSNMRLHTRTKYHASARVCRCLATSASALPRAAVRPPSTIHDSVAQCRAAFRLYREAKTEGSLAKANPSAPYRATIELPLPMKQTLLNPFSDDVRGERIRPADQGDWPGGMVQQYRALKPLIDDLVEGYGAEFKGMLGGQEDGMGVWRMEGITVVCNVLDLTFAPFSQLCAGEFGASVASPEHMVLVVNPGWTSSKGIGQFWDRKLKQQAKELIDDAQWDPLYCCRAVRTAQNAHGLLVKAYPGPWLLYPRPCDDAEVAGDCLLESEELPERQLMARLLNEAQPHMQSQFSAYLKEREQARSWF